MVFLSPRPERCRLTLFQNLLNSRHRKLRGQLCIDIFYHQDYYEEIYWIKFYLQSRVTKVEQWRDLARHFANVATNALNHVEGSFSNASDAITNCFASVSYAFCSDCLLIFTIIWDLDRDWVPLFLLQGLLRVVSLIDALICSLFHLF